MLIANHVREVRYSFDYTKLFKPRSISSSYSVIVQVRTTLTRTITLYEVLIMLEIKIAFWLVKW